MEPNHTLLIAEDEPEIRDLLSEKLKTLGYPIVIARDGQEMLDRALQDPGISAILSDIKMPGRTGLDVLRELRTLGLETPIVFLTAFGDKRMVIEALRFGAMDFLEKPWSDEALIATMAQAMELGCKLKTLDRDLDALAKKYQVQPSDFEKFKAIQRPVLLMKLKNQIFFKKKAG